VYQDSEVDERTEAQLRGMSFEKVKIRDVAAQEKERRNQGATHEEANSDDNDEHVRQDSIMKKEERGENKGRYEEDDEYEDDEGFVNNFD